MRENDLPAHVVKEIFLHHVIKGNPYTQWFAKTKDGPSTAQVKDLVIQISVLAQESIILRRMHEIGAAKATPHMSDAIFSHCLHDVARAVPLDPNLDLKGHI